MVLDGNTVAFTQEQFDAYAAEYEFGARRSGGSEAKLSPVEREARRIARDRLDARLRELGKKIDKKSDEGKANYETLIAQIAAKPEVLREAEKRVKAVDKISIEELGLDLSGATAQAQAA